MLLEETNYDKTKSTHLILSFSRGFDIGCRGPEDRRDTAENLPLKLGSKTLLWNKVMAEVKENRYAGPFKINELPFRNFMQSPIGLVPKAGNKKKLDLYFISHTTLEKRTAKNLLTSIRQTICAQ